MKKWLLLFLLAASSAQALELAINTTANGPTTLISAVAGHTLRVQCLWIVNSSATATTFYLSDSAGALTGPLALQPYGVFNTPWPNQVWFTCFGGSSITMTQTGGAQLSGRLYYTQD